MANFKGIVRLSEEQYKQLVEHGSVTSGETVVTFDENTLYLTEFDDNAEAKSKEGIKTVKYDNTTLSEHIPEILELVNQDDGGSLISVGFKIGAQQITADTREIIYSGGDVPTVTTLHNSVILSSGTFYNAYPEQIIVNDETKSVYFSCRNGFTSGRGILNINNSVVDGQAKLSGETTYLSDNITQESFQDVDVINTPLEHLIIKYRA